MLRQVIEQNADVFNKKQVAEGLRNSVICPDDEEMYFYPNPTAMLLDQLVCSLEQLEPSEQIQAKLQQLSDIITHVQRFDPNIGTTDIE